MITKAVGYRDPSRKFTVRTLINFFLLASVHEWKSFRHGADVSPSYGLPRFHTRPWRTKPNPFRMT